MNRKILVTGATGKVGTAVVNVLHDHGLNVVATITKPESSKQFEHWGIGTKVMDFGNEKSVEKALSNIAEVFMVMPLGPYLNEWTQRFVDIAKQKSIKHVVRLSVTGADSNSPLALCKAHGEADDILANSGVNYTILRPNMFMQNFVAYHGQSIKEQHAFYLPHGNGKIALVDVRDIALVAATVLEKPSQHRNKIYELTGPQAISNTEAATAISEAIHQTVGYVPVEDAQAREGAVQMGAPPWLILALEELNKSIRDGQLARITPTVKDITGHTPHSFTQFAHDYSGSWK